MSKVSEFRIGMEKHDAGDWYAWVLDLPGCCAQGSSRKRAAAALSSAIIEFSQWMNRNGAQPLRPISGKSKIAYMITEEFIAFPSPEVDGVMVRAFFKDDRRPLSLSEVELALRLLTIARRELIDLLESVPASKLAIYAHAERYGSINGMLSHIAATELMYCESLGMVMHWHDFPPDMPMAQLASVRDHTNHCLLDLVDDDRVRERDGEKWSARKLVRRLLWHERKHTAEIASLL